MLRFGRVCVKQREQRRIPGEIGTGEKKELRNDLKSRGRQARKMHIQPGNEKKEDAEESTENPQILEGCR